MVNRFIHCFSWAVVIHTGLHSIHSCALTEHSQGNVNAMSLVFTTHDLICRIWPEASMESFKFGYIGTLSDQ